MRSWLPGGARRPGQDVLWGGAVAIEERFLTRETSFGMTELSANQGEDAMRTGIAKPEARGVRRILPVMLRITVSLILWTLGAGMAMNAAAEPVKERRVVYTFAVDRAQTENLQRWVNQGHDAWCRDPQIVAVAAIRRVSEELEEVQAASMPLELERREKAAAVYTFHSLDGLKTYRITLKRYAWLLPTAGSMHRMIWVPEKAEIV